MPQAAIEAIADYSVAYTCLEKLARQERQQGYPDASVIESTDETDETG